MTRTFLLTDIEGSTRQWEESPAMNDQVERHFDVLRTAVEHGGGEVFATMGDGIAAAFPSADAAVQAAISAQRDMSPIGLKVRMGVHTGEARARELLSRLRSRHSGAGIRAGSVWRAGAAATVSAGSRHAL